MILDTAPLLLWSRSPDGGANYCNQRCAEYMGMTREAVLSEGWQAAIHPDDLQRMLQQRDNARKSGIRLDLEHRLRGADGSYRWFLSRSCPVRGAKGDIVQWVGSAVDIEARKQAEESLQRSEQVAQQQLAEIEACYNTAPVGLCVLDTDLRYVRINERLAKLHGVSASAHIGRTVREILPSATADKADPVLREVIRSGEPLLNFEIDGVTPDGTAVAAAGDFGSHGGWHFGGRQRGTGHGL